MGRLVTLYNCYPSSLVTPISQTKEMRPRDVRKLPEVTQPQSAPRSGPNPSFLQKPPSALPLPFPPLPFLPTLSSS